MTRVDDTLYAVRGKIWIAVKGRRARDLGNEWVVWVREGKITANSLVFVVVFIIPRLLYVVYNGQNFILTTCDKAI